MSVTTKASATLRRFREERSGQVMILFGLSIIPIMFATAAAVDYGRRGSARAQLDAAVDAAALAVMSRVTSNTIPPTSLTQMEKQFRDEAARVPGVTVTGFKMTPKVEGKTLSLTARYDATINTSFSKLMDTSAMKITGMATSARNVMQYIDFYLLLDNSPSMGLAATDADIAKMQGVTPDQCAFACHKHTFDANGVVTGDDLNDYYHVAKNNGIKLRIDNLRDAVVNLVDTAKSSMKLTQQYRMEVWTFSDIQTQISALSPNLDQTKTDAAKIDLAYSLWKEPDNQTSYERALPKMDSVVPTSGTGLVATSPIRFLFFVTDGVQDTPIDGTVTSSGAGFQINPNRYINTLAPSLCKSLKDRDVRIGIIYTKYLPLMNNDFYKSNVLPFQDNIPTNLKACATDGLFFPVTTNGDISAAMQALFQAAVASVRLTD